MNRGHRLRKIDNIMFRVKDLDASAKFCTGVLGLKQVWRDDEQGMIGFIFSESDSEVVIHTITDITSPGYSFLVDNVEEFVKEFKDRGYTVRTEPFDVRTGKFAVLADPDDNIISIIDLSKFGGKPRYD